MKKIAGFHVFAGIVIGIVAAAVIAGLFIAGTPGKERERRFDEQRVADLQQIASAVDFRYERTGNLPDALQEFTVQSSDYYIRSLNDPETGAPYEYRVAGESSYDLCAVFDLPSTSEPANAAAKPVAPYPYRDQAWQHPAGRHCFTLDAELRIPKPSCGIRNPCAAGQTCAVLPDREGAFCLPEGKECLAAGCPGACTIAKSYPAQVRCVDEGPETSGCQLMSEKNTGRVDCFGCGTRVCKDPSADWEPYTLPPDYVGIPYSCYIDESGACALAQ